MDKTVLMDKTVFQVSMVAMVPTENSEPMVNLDLPDLRENPAKTELLEIKDPLVNLVYLVMCSMVMLVNLVNLVKMVCLELLVPRVPKEKLVTMETMVMMVFLE